MNYFTLLYKKNELLISQDEQKNLIDSFRTMIPYNYMHYYENNWISTNRKIFLIASNNDPVISKAAVYHENENYITNISGYIVDSQLNNEATLDDFVKLLEIKKRTSTVSFGGIYTVLQINKNLNEVHAWNTITRVSPLYFTETRDEIIISNRASIIAKYLSPNNMEYNLEAFYPFLINGFFANELTPYKNVNVVPPNCHVVIKNNNIFFEQIDDFLDVIGTEELSNEFLDEITHALIEASKPIKSSLNIRCALTGGKDSRLIVGALYHTGVAFPVYTAGFAEHPDVIIAKQISKILKLEHINKKPKIGNENNELTMQVDPLSRTQNVLFNSDGMVFGYEGLDARPKIFNNKTLSYGGAGGESLRGGYARGKENVTQNGVTSFFEKYFFNYGQLINDKYRLMYSGWLENWVNTQLNINKSAPPDILDLFYLYYRTGKWCSQIYMSNYANYVQQPLLDNRVTKLALKVKYQYRLNERLIYEILKRLSPELTEVPFFNSKWKFMREDTKHIAPLSFTQKSSSAFNWRFEYTSQLWSHFYEVFSKSANQIFELINKELFFEFFGSQFNQVPNRSFGRTVWGIYSACILFSNRWINPVDAGNLITIKIKETDYI